MKKLYGVEGNKDIFFHTGKGKKRGEKRGEEIRREEKGGGEKRLEEKRRRVKVSTYTARQVFEVFFFFLNIVFLLFNIIN